MERKEEAAHVPVPERKKPAASRGSDESEVGFFTISGR
jgi:hypothetical protein